jgi:L-alanine-DL-glutamate epimerase-like enolase superfamily enzyme
LWLTDDEGRVGLGEAAPLPGYSRDDAGACERALGALPGALGAIERVPDEPSVAAVRRALAPLAPALDGVPAARFAIETALLDLLGQRLGQSIAMGLGGPRPYAEVQVNGLLAADAGPEALVRGAHALVARGLRSLKVKLRSRDEAAFEAELAALAALRREVAGPGEIELRLDANGAWTEDQARRRLQALAPLAPRFVEQPVAPDRLDGLGPCAVPWAADESLGVPGMPERLLEAAACAVFVLKPAALGLLRAHEIGVRAQARGLDVVVTHLFDGPIGLAAACELALSLPRPPLACGLDAHAGLAAWPEVPVPQRRRDGLITAAGRPGLGIAPWTG